MNSAVRQIVLSKPPPAPRLFGAITSGGGAYPDATHKTMYETLIASLQSNGLWPKIDLLHIMAGQDEVAALLNLKNPSITPLVKNGSLTFTQDRGYAGDASTGRFSSAHNPTTFAGAYTLNDAVAGVFIQTVSIVNSALEFFLNGTSRFQVASNGLTYQYRINDAASGNGTLPTAGHWALRRSTSAVRSLWKNGASIANDTQASTTMPTVVALLSSGAANFSSSTLAAFYLGGGFSDADMVAMNTILTAAMTTLGAA